MKKIIFLILTLAIPVSIFLFLKIFGNNEFEVPVFFVEGIPGCDEIEEAHLVNVAGLMNEDGEIINIENLSNFLIFTPLVSQDKSIWRERILQMVRIQDAFYEIGSPQFILMADQYDSISFLQSELMGGGLSDVNYTFVFSHSNDLNDFLNCELGLITREEVINAPLVLVDPERKIRGIYDGLDLEQTEQLILELKILCKQL
jgi:protein SCO1